MFWQPFEDVKTVESRLGKSTYGTNRRCYRRKPLRTRGTKPFGPPHFLKLRPKLLFGVSGSP